jgi:hypothetical protein
MRRLLLLLLLCVPASADTIVSPNFNFGQIGSPFNDISRAFSREGHSDFEANGITWSFDYDVRGAVAIGEPESFIPGHIYAFSGSVDPKGVSGSIPGCTPQGDTDPELPDCFNLTLSGFFVGSDLQNGFIFGIVTGTIDPAFIAGFQLPQSTSTLVRGRFFFNVLEEGDDFLGEGELTLRTHTVPEPATLALFSGGILMAHCRRQFFSQ